MKKITILFFLTFGFLGIATPTTTLQVNGNTKVVKYTVKAGEGKWRIAHNHGITEKQLQELNPNLPEVLKEGSQIFVPALTLERKELMLYLVEKGEGFFSLERKFNLTKEELLQLNPSLKDGVKANEHIWVPRQNYLNAQQLKTTEKTTLSEKKIEPKVENTSVKVQKIKFEGEEKNISLVLPFKTTGATPAEIRERLYKDKMVKYASDFYAGALFAIDTLQKMGHNIVINVFDSQGIPQGIDELPLDKLKQSDAIIGPFIPSVFNHLANQISNIPIYAPLSNKNIEPNENVFVTVPTQETLHNHLIEYTKSTYPNANVLFVADTNGQHLIKKLNDHFPKGKNTAIANLKSAVNTNKVNLVFLQSNSASFISEAVRTLHEISGLENHSLDCNIVIVTLEKNDAFEHSSVSSKQLSNLKFTYPSTNKHAGDNDFSKKYQETYKTTPNRYTYRGFDLLLDIISRNPENPAKQNIFLENKFEYSKNPKGGYENTGCYILQIENMQVKPVLY